MAKRKRKISKPVRRKKSTRKVSHSKSSGKAIGVKLKKYPKRPKASASTATLQNYLKKVKEIDRENAERVSLSKSIGHLLGK